MNNYVYEVGNNLYINLTNKCSNDCFFCIRNGHDDMNGTNLWIDREPNFDDVVNQLPHDLSKYDEIVFCGFGEPTYQIDLMCQLGRYFKSKGKTTRINTNGQANLIFGDDVTEKMVGAIDKVNVSLNASNAKEYQRICKSVFGEDAFEGMLEFAHQCQDLGMDVVMSVVDIIGKDEVDACQQLCDERGLKLRVRVFE